MMMRFVSPVVVGLASPEPPVPFWLVVAPLPPQPGRLTASAKNGTRNEERMDNRRMGASPGVGTRIHRRIPERPEGASTLGLSCSRRHDVGRARNSEHDHCGGSLSFCSSAC